MTVQHFDQRDWPAVWRIVEPVFRAGETYPYAPDIDEAQAHGVWIEAPASTYVFVDDGGAILGTYYLKPNQPGLGAHVCNCGYIVAERARGQGVASEMCRHSLREALAEGYRAMQFNLVVSTNEGAVRLWQTHGFDTVGTLPGAFCHAKLGYVDAYVMFRTLV